MEDGVPGHHGHPAVEIVVVEVNTDQDLVILLLLNMEVQVVMDLKEPYSHATPEIVQVMFFEKLGIKSIIIFQS